MSYRRTRAWLDFIERRRFAQLNEQLREHAAVRARDALARAPHS